MSASPDKRDGWVLVPRTPTKEMVRAAAAAMSPGKRPTQLRVSCNQKHAIRYEAMLAAAPKPPEGVFIGLLRSVKRRPIVIEDDDYPAPLHLDQGGDR